jgi:hypothetical protein
MAAVTVYDDIEARLASQYSVAKYIGNDALWDRVVDSLLALPAAGSHAMQLDGRLDVASWNIYGTAELDWVLAVYNGAKGVGSDVPLRESAEAVVKLAAGRFMGLTAPIHKEDISASCLGEAVALVAGPEGTVQADLDGDGNPDIRIAWAASGMVVVSNIGAFEWEVVLSYYRYLTDESLMAGQTLTYPSIADVSKALSDSVNKEQAKTFTGFARL